MFEAIFEMLFEVFGEILLQIFAEFFSEFLIESLRSPLREERSVNRWLAGLGALLMGTAAGALSLWLVPHSLARSRKVPGISLILSPMLTGLLMEVMGAWRRRGGGHPSFLATFMGGSLFAFAMAYVRLHFLGH